MGKKSKRNPKVPKAFTDVKPTESPNYNFAGTSSFPHKTPLHDFY